MKLWVWSFCRYNKVLEEMETYTAGPHNTTFCCNAVQGIACYISVKYMTTLHSQGFKNKYLEEQWIKMLDLCSYFLLRKNPFNMVVANRTSAVIK